MRGRRGVSSENCDAGGLGAVFDPASFASRGWKERRRAGGALDPRDVVRLGVESARDRVGWGWDGLGIECTRPSWDHCMDPLIPLSVHTRQTVLGAPVLRPQPPG